MEGSSGTADPSLSLPARKLPHHLDATASPSRYSLEKTLVPLVTPARESRLTIAPDLGQQNVEISPMILGWPLRRSDVQSQYARRPRRRQWIKGSGFTTTIKGWTRTPPLSESGMLVAESRRREASAEKKSA